jgi:hypothetical protein
MPPSSDPARLTLAEVRRHESAAPSTPESLAALVGVLADDDLCEDLAVATAAIHSLRRVFTGLHHSGRLRSGGVKRSRGADGGGGGGGGGGGVGVVGNWQGSQFSTREQTLTQAQRGKEGKKGKVNDRSS